jgi:hypothetical protein
MADTTSRRRDTRAATLKLAAAFCAAASFVAVDARAAVTRFEDEVIIQSHEVIEDDLIVYGEYLRIDGVVKGDLVAIGQEIVIEGIVEGDLFALGKTVYLNGAVNDDARVAAYALALGESSRVADDFFALAYSLEAKPGSRVGGTLYAASRQALLAGQVAESVRLRAGALELRGLIGADARAIVGGLEGFSHSSMVIDLALEIPEIDDGLRIAASTHIGGDLDYRAAQPANIEPGASIAGRTAFEPTRKPAAPLNPEELKHPDRGDRVGDALTRLATLVALGLLLVLLAPRWAQARGATVRGSPVLALGWGFGAVVFTAMASLVLGSVCAILLVAFSLLSGGLAVSIAIAGFLLQAALLAPFLLTSVYLAPVLFSLGAGLFALEKLGAAGADAEHDPRRGAAAVCVGALVYTSLRALPGFGPLVAVIGGLMGLGAIALWLREHRSLAART